ncbi:hypothetical protein HHK36_023733 [Tetracentron sinense]|uniref:Uncharacterized protein n=1 Tax=Tetracentron sinense TaxID=13715 RepID=A0A835D5H2_TETSI|nr:hypothetical protein HHK36_023733 [Tetracentron sinense]
MTIRILFGERLRWKLSLIPCKFSTSFRRSFSVIEVSLSNTSGFERSDEDKFEPPLEEEIFKSGPNLGSFKQDRMKQEQRVFPEKIFILVFKAYGKEHLLDEANPEDNSTYVSLFIALASEGMDVWALFELTLVDQSGKGKHKLSEKIYRSLDKTTQILRFMLPFPISPGKTGSHFHPSSDLFVPNENNDVITSTACWTAMTALLVGWVIPYNGSHPNGLCHVVGFGDLHHHGHEQKLPWYRGKTEAAKPVLGKFYREPKISGPLPFYLIGSLIRSMKQDHYGNDTRDIVYYQTDPQLSVSSLVLLDAIGGTDVAAHINSMGSESSTGYRNILRVDPSR